MTTNVEQSEMTAEEFVEMIKAWLLSKEGPAGANLELHTDDELHILAAFIAEKLFEIHCKGRDLGRVEGRAEVETWRRGLENKWPLWAGLRGN